jgi:hypothetical protein
VKRSPLTRRTRLKAVNAKRRKKEYTRCYESRARVAWAKRQPCMVFPSGGCDGPMENAHIVTDGMGRKADSRYVVPLCHAHHCLLHVMGTALFERTYTISLAYGAEQTEAAWRAHADVEIASAD